MNTYKIDGLIKKVEFALNEIAKIDCNSLYEQKCNVCNAEEALIATKLDLQQMKELSQ